MAEWHDAELEPPIENVGLWLHHGGELKVVMAHFSPHRGWIGASGEKFHAPLAWTEIDVPEAPVRIVRWLEADQIDA